MCATAIERDGLEQLLKKPYASSESSDTTKDAVNRRFSVAPMLDLTDRHARYIMRLLSQHALLYTEMVTINAILRGDRERFLRFNTEEHPIALQLGGSDPEPLAECSRMAEDYGYVEVNLKVGCPSDRDQSGRCGACLMAEPKLVGDCIQRMQQAVSIPVTVKCRIGIDRQDSYDELYQFIETVRSSGCRTFIVHARKAWLDGLSPKENREIPPLRYEVVHQLKQDFPDLEIIINGGLTDFTALHEQLAAVDGVMVGREAYHSLYFLAQVDQQLYGAANPIPTRSDVFQQFVDYTERQVAEGVPLHHLTRHILGLYRDCPGARAFRRFISENVHKPGASTALLQEAFARVSDNP